MPPSPAPSTTLDPLALLKIYLHAARYPSSTVTGLLVGTVTPSASPSAPSAARIVDVVPLLHHYTSLSPAMEAGLQLAEIYVKQQGWTFLGLYVANERLGDQSVPRSIGKAAERIGADRPEAVVLVVDNEKLSSTEPAFLPHHIDASSSTWLPSPLSSSLTLSDPSAVSQALEQIRTGRATTLGDFDAHLEDARVDWLRNAAVGLQA